MAEKLALLPRKLEDPQKPEQVLQSLHKHPCRRLSAIFMPLSVLIPLQSQALCPDLCFVPVVAFEVWDSRCGDGLRDRTARGCITCSSWEPYCRLAAHVEDDVNLACSSPTQPLETPPLWSQAFRFCLKKIRKVYQQRIDRQSPPAEQKITWSSRTATCCSCLRSDCGTADHFTASAACHQGRSQQYNVEASPTAIPGLNEGFHLYLLVPPPRCTTSAYTLMSLP